MNYNNMGRGSFKFHQILCEYACLYIIFLVLGLTYQKLGNCDYTKLPLFQQPVSGSFLAQIPLRMMQKTLFWVICPFSTWVIPSWSLQECVLRFAVFAVLL